MLIEIENLDTLDESTKLDIITAIFDCVLLTVLRRFLKEHNIPGRTNIYKAYQTPYIYNEKHYITTTYSWGEATSNTLSQQQKDEERECIKHILDYVSLKDIIYFGFTNINLETLLEGILLCYMNKVSVIFTKQDDQEAYEHLTGSEESLADI